MPICIKKIVAFSLKIFCLLLRRHSGASCLLTAHCHCGPPFPGNAQLARNVLFFLLFPCGRSGVTLGYGGDRTGLGQ